MATPPSSSYTARVATPDDAAALSALAERTFVHLATTVHKEDISPEDLVKHIANSFPVEVMRKEIEDPKRTTVFIFTKEDPVNPCGFAMFTDGSLRPGDEAVAKPEDHLEIKRVYVDIPYIGTGAAKFLMDNVMEMVKAKNKKLVWVGTGVRNVRAHKFYQKIGFEFTGQRFFQIGTVTHHDYVFTLKSSEAATP